MYGVLYWVFRKACVLFSRQISFSTRESLEKFDMSTEQLESIASNTIDATCPSGSNSSGTNLTLDCLQMIETLCVGEEFALRDQGLFCKPDNDMLEMTKPFVSSPTETLLTLSHKTNGGSVQEAVYLSSTTFEPAVEMTDCPDALSIWKFRKNSICF